jgi:hypothetical protein
MADVVAEDVKWLWPGRIPKGHLTILDGDPGLGKTTLLIDIIARITRGDPMPDGSFGWPGAALLISAEDAMGDTIQPRCQAASANLKHVHALDSIVRFPQDSRDLQRIIEDKGVVILVLDPLSAYLGERCNAHVDADVRRALAPMKDLATETGVALVGIRHLNKSGQGSPLYRGGGSIAFTAAARSVMMTGKSPLATGPDDDSRILASVKSNLCRMPRALEYQMISEGAVPRIAWGNECDVQAYDLCNPATKGEDMTKLETAEEFLKAELEDGAVKVESIRATASNLGFSWATIKRAKAHLEIRSIKSGLQGGWTWAMPV